MYAMKRMSLLALLISLVLLVAACGNSSNKSNTATDNSNASANSSASSNNAVASEDSTASESEATFRTLTDVMGHEVQVPTHPKRIIAPFMEDPLAALNLKPVAQWGAGGVPQHYLQDQLKDIPVLDMNGGLKPEEALSYKPDLIIFLAPTYIADGSYEQFAKIAPTFVLSEDEADWRGNMQKLGALLNEEDAAKQALDSYDQKLATAKATLGTLPANKTAVVLQADEEKGFALFGPNFYGGATLYGALGFKQPAVLKGEYEQYSIEALAELKDVDYIFLITGEGRGKPPVNNTLWKSLSAVKAGHVFDADSGHWFNANPIANDLIISDVLKDIHE
ncbi:ABC transporter substrate-binding protein [Paenibacillus sp. CF384]|uniref:ABC transporter substrate-binding protein n=1 Tax=Paenibacillus sp. CF384 TaxID=1884382 RepID=UPI000895206A|nr:ABC transporter substrate-binding protein [Paenibacillus sp. CF384]SDX56173.1 iron complex transport system substrate-binding protein [Paenibacillus sp. CF384]